MAWTYTQGTDGYLYAVQDSAGVKVTARRAKDTHTWTVVETLVEGTKVDQDVVANNRLTYILEAGKPQTPGGGTPLPPPTPPAPTPPAPTGKWPALPSNAQRVMQQTFESGTVGSSFTSNQCLGHRNKIVNDPFGAGYGKVWEGESMPGDAPVANHANRCEMSDMGSDGRGVFIYRLVFAVPNDGSATGGDGASWMYRLQFHGSNPSTSPPIAAFTDRASDSSKFALRFASGDSRNYHSDALGPFPKGQWIHLQLHVNWNGANSWMEADVNGQAQTLKGQRRKTFTMQVSQGMPASVYGKYGLDMGSLTKRAHGYVALVEKYKVG